MSVNYSRKQMLEQFTRISAWETDAVRASSDLIEKGGDTTSKYVEAATAAADNTRYGGNGEILANIIQEEKEEEE